MKQKDSFYGLLLKYIQKKISFSKRLSLLKENKIFLLLIGALTAVALSILMFPKALIRNRNIKNARAKGWWLLAFVIIVILYQMRYINF